MNRISPLMFAVAGIIGCFGLATSIPVVLGQSLILPQPDDLAPGNVETTRRIVVTSMKGPSAEVQQLIQKWRETDAKDSTARKSLEQELIKQLAAQFDQHQQERERQIAELQKRLDQLRDIQTRRSANKEEIVARHAQNLLFDAEGMGWGGEGRGWNGEGADPNIVTEDILLHNDSQFRATNSLLRN